MSRFFVDKHNIYEDKIIITGEDVKHIKNVLRMQPGEKVQLCDGDSTDYNCVIGEIENNQVVCRIESKEFSTTEPKIWVTLFQGMPKGDKLEQIIQKCIELGIAEIVPVITRRTIVKFENDKDIDKKIARYKKIAQEAGKQCNRGRIPKVQKPVFLKEAIKLADNYDLKLIPYENEKENKIKTVLNGSDRENLRSIAFFIGPEGGFDEEEVRNAITAGIIPVTLGTRILRTETAGPAVLAMLMYAFDEI